MGQGLDWSLLLKVRTRGRGSEGPAGASATSRCVTSGGNCTPNASHLGNWDNRLSLLDAVEETMHEKC